MPAVLGPEPLAAGLLTAGRGLEGVEAPAGGVLGGQREGLEAAAGGSLGVKREEPPRNCSASATCDAHSYEGRQLDCLHTVASS